VTVRCPLPVDGTRDYAERAAAPNPPRSSDGEVRHASARSRLHPGAGALPTPLEADEQRTLAQWLDMLGVLWCAVPNGGARRKVEAKILVGLGVKVGVPDILIFDPPPARPGRCGAAIELKRIGEARPGPGQQEWLDALERRGWAAALCEGAAMAIQWLEGLGYGRRR